MTAPLNQFVICLQFLRVEERELGSPYTGPEAQKKGPLFVKKVPTQEDQETTHPGKGGADPLCPPAAAFAAGEEASERTPTTTAPGPQETSLEKPQGKGSAKGLQVPQEEKSSATIFLTVPGPHSPGPIKSPRPVQGPAAPFVWPPHGLASSVASLNSLTSCFDLTSHNLRFE